MAVCPNCYGERHDIPCLALLRAVFEREIVVFASHRAKTRTGLYKDNLSISACYKHYLSYEVFCYQERKIYLFVRNKAKGEHL
jgi:hypothetical protein